MLKQFGILVLVKQKQVIELLQDVRHNAYKLGYIEGIEYEKAEHTKHVERIEKELHIQQQRVSWFQDKYTRMQENYENQIKNLQDKIKHLDEHINYMKELERRC